MSTLAKKEAYNIEPKNFGELMKYAEMIAGSDLAPKDYRGKPANVLVAIQMGAEVGLKPMQALQNIAVINGRPSIWGDAALALVQSSPVCEYVREKGDSNQWTCTVKRKDDDEPHVVTFTQEKATKAGLWNKEGPWSKHPDRMLQMRARGFALRDKFSDVLKGLILVEEARDYPTDENIKYVNEKSKGNEGLKNVLGLAPEAPKVDEAPEQPKAEEAPEQVDIETGEVIDTWAIQQAINAALDLNELEAIAEDIKDLKDKLDAEQLKFLKSTYKKRKEELSGNG